MNLTNDQKNNSTLFPTNLGQISFEVFIHDINTMNNKVDIHIFATHLSFLINASSINIEIFGGSDSYVYIQLSHVVGNVYFGGSGRIEWDMLGTGDSYPFDSYELEFIIGSKIIYQINNETKVLWRSWDEPKGSGKAFFNISVEFEAAKIVENEEILAREWKIYAGEIPVSHYLIEGFVFEIKRKSLVPFLEFILPIEVCYYLLGSSMFLDRRKPADRLRVYVSLFVFASTFIFLIHEFLPPRSLLSLTELLLINLITSSGIIAVFSLIPVRFERHGKVLDTISLVISSIIFTYIYCLLFGDILEETSYIFLLSLMGLYFSKLVSMIFYTAKLIRARAL